MKRFNTSNKLPLKFYQRNVHKVAKELLGKIFVRKFNCEYLSGRIVEIEAYDGKIDMAAHSYNGKTKRNEVMFKGGGTLYVYFTYGMYFCANVVTGYPEDGCAILIRGIEPIAGIESMSKARFNKLELSDSEQKKLTNGPGKICQAFYIDKSDNGTSLLSDTIFILDSKNYDKNEIISSRRIGIKKSVDLPWRYFLKNNQYVSNLKLPNKK